MPHKHRRLTSRNDASNYDLPPSKKASALPVKRNPTIHNSQTSTKPTMRKHAQLDDDTPRAFSRLFAGYRPPRSGLDDGIRPKKKRKVSAVDPEETATAPNSIPTPTIHPHESLSSFNARVDAALPFAGISKRSAGGKEMGLERKTKTEKKMQKMQREWREEERRRKERLEEAKDEDGVDEDALDDIPRAAKKRKRKGGKKDTGGAEGDIAAHDDDDDDPWAHIQATRTEEVNGKSTGGLIGLHDVVLAPPKFSKLPKDKGNTMIKSGTTGLKRQAELSEARARVINSYRQMMKDKRTEDE